MDADHTTAITMTEQVPLSHWMLGPLASIEATNTIFPIHKVLLEMINHSTDEGNRNNDDLASKKIKSPSEIYYENAAKISFCLVQEILLLDGEHDDGRKTSLIGLDLNNISVTLHVTDNNSSMTIQGVNLGKNENDNFPASEEQRLRSLGVIFYKLFTRQDLFPEAVLAEEPNENEDGEGEDDAQCSITPEIEDDEKNFDMMHALSELDIGVPPLAQANKKRHKNSQQEHSIGSQKPHIKHTKRHTSTFSSICTYAQLPDAVCRFVADLLDAPRPQSSESCFTSMIQVLQDLHQMANDPCVYLHNRFQYQCTPCKLDFGSRLIGRKEEVRSIIEVANRIASEKTTADESRLELISISGFCGSGKSKLMQRVRELLAPRSLSTGSKKWFFLQSSFERTQQYDARTVIASSFETYCKEVISMKNDGAEDNIIYCNNLSSALLEKLGRRGIVTLSDWMPSFPQIFSAKEIKDFEQWDNASNSCSAVDAKMAQGRLEYLFSEFLLAVLSLKRPVMLFLEDCHWADVPIFDFVAQLLRSVSVNSEARRNLFFVNTFRTNEVGTHAMYTWISGVRANSFMNHTWLKLDGLPEGILNNSLSHLLRLPCRLTASLARVVKQKTIGNLLCVQEFLHSLMDREGKKLLYFGIEQRRWLWDYREISKLPIEKGAAKLLATKLSKIEEQYLDCLTLLSCIGMRVSLSIIDAIDGVRDITDLRSSIDELVDESLLEMEDSFVAFPSDSILQAVRQITPEDRRAQLHLDIGSAIIRHMASIACDDPNAQSQLDGVFIAAIEQVNHSFELSVIAIPPIEYSRAQCISFAKMNLKAAHKKGSGFHSALRNLKFGLSFLKASSKGLYYWAENYDLSLALSEEYAYAMLVKGGNETEINECVNEIIANAKCLKDSCKAYEILILALYASGKKLMAVDQALVILRKFKFPFPTMADKNAVTEAVKMTRNFVAKLSVDDLVYFPLMNDEICIQAMRIMDAAIMAFYQSAPTLFPLLVAQMILLTSQHGCCDESVSAFGAFAFIELSLFRSFDEAYRVGMLAISMLNRTNASKKVARVYSSIYGIVGVWKQPIHALIDPLMKASDIGFAEGDGENAMLCMKLVFRQRFLAGMDLIELRNDQEEFIKRHFFQTSHYAASKIRMPCILQALLGDLSVTLTLTGGCDELSKLVGNATEEKRLSEAALNLNESSYALDACHHNLVKSFFFNDYDAVFEFSEKYLSRRGDLQEWSLGRFAGRMGDIYSTFFGGLACFILSRKKSQPELINKGNLCVLEMESWSQSCEFNYENKLLLLKAEQCLALGDCPGAGSYYQRSINSAKKHKFIHEEAIAQELFARFLGQNAFGCKHYDIARELYRKWGAHEKVATMTG